MAACTAEHGDRAGNSDSADAGWSGLSRVAADSVRTIQAFQSKFRQRPEDGCGLDGAVIGGSHRPSAGAACPHSGGPLSVRAWCITLMIVEERPNDD